MAEPLLIETLRCRDNSKIGRLTLNRPKALNALSLEMIDMMHRQLAMWENQKDIVLVIIEGADNTAFCAGGDVRAVYHAMRENAENAKEDTAAFFAREYRLDYAIHQYKKPILAWGNGYVMGGGLGVYMGAKFRIVTENTTMAMPEITIGLYPDVGASYFLNQLPGGVGRFLGLTGAQLNAADAVSLKMAEQFIVNKSYQEVVGFLQDQTWSNDVDENCEIISEILESFAFDCEEKLPTSNIAPHLDLINEIFIDNSLENIIDVFLAHKTRDKWLESAQNNLSKGSPLSAVIIDRQLRISKNYDLKRAFQSEYALSHNIMLHSGDFEEGVRARLVDKDNAPNWRYKNVCDIPANDIEHFFAPLKAENPLNDL